MSNKDISEDNLKQIIVEGKVDTLVIQAEKFGRKLARDKLTKRQIRNVFGEVRKIQAGWSHAKDDGTESMRRLLLLKPRMAYQATREETAAPLLAVLTDAIDMVANTNNDDIQYKRFSYFVEFFEAVLAYHTAQGGKD